MAQNIALWKCGTTIAELMGVVRCHVIFDVIDPSSACDSSSGREHALAPDGPLPHPINIRTYMECTKLEDRNVEVLIVLAYSHVVGVPLSCFK